MLSTITDNNLVYIIIKSVKLLKFFRNSFFKFYCS